MIRLSCCYIIGQSIRQSIEVQFVYLCLFLFCHHASDNTSNKVNTETMWVFIFIFYHVHFSQIILLWSSHGRKGYPGF